MSKPFYLTTTLAYINAEPHLGFATELIRADIIARWRRLLGDEVFFNTGTDEHGQKVYEKALLAGQTPPVYADFWSLKFRHLVKSLNLSEDINFIRTTDPQHILAAQAFWKLCADHGFIEKKSYQVKYCVGCELEKSASELVEGHCPWHPASQLELREELNYFFKFSKCQADLLKLYETNPDFVLPRERLHEIKTFVAGGLQDFSISRLAEKMPWGIPVPGDETQVMYVWFDALVNYVSAIGWPDDRDNFTKWWLTSGGVVQFCGKDNLRQQAAIWQAMLLAAGLPYSQKIIVEGFITMAGQKMSKSLGNVVNPLEIVERYGVDALRYFVARELALFEDSDFTWERFKEVYNANLANGLGNLVSRIMKMAVTHLDVCPVLSVPAMPEDFAEFLANYEIGRATDLVWQKIGELDGQIQRTEPFKLIKTNQAEALVIIKELVVDLYTIGQMIRPLMPATATLIEEMIKANKMPEQPLFPRQD